MSKDRKTNLSNQALNSIELYKGGNPDTIEQLLIRQSSSVVNEIKEYYECTDIKELAIKCSIGK